MNLILSKIILDKDLNSWSKLKSQYFQAPYTLIYQQIAKFYEKFSKLPSFEELELVIRDDNTLNMIQAIKDIEIPEDLDADVLIQALVNEYAQKEVLSGLNSLVDDIVFMDAPEMVENLGRMAIELEEKTESSEQIVVMSDYKTVDEDDLKSFTPIGLSNDFDQFSLGLAPTELMLIGGFRGSGKSIVCGNVTSNQYLQGNSSLYFSIEMRGKEIFQRHLSMLSGVKMSNIRKNELTPEDKQMIAKTRSDMHTDGATLYQDYLDHGDFEKFEDALIQTPLNEDNQIIIVDNQSLSLANIDATVQTYKTKFKEKLRIVVVDYINVITAKDPLEWKTQLAIAAGLKKIARKHDIAIIAPFQTDEKGGVRFSKGILDAPDWAFNLDAGEESIKFECKKTRGTSIMDFESLMEWDSLRIIPNRNLLTEQQEEPDVPEEGLPWGEDDL
ncbi:MAG: hypothetical protein GY810_28395 [Aureispira sp.]|nr:hypothetical protein [Aureispira sp.]